MSEAARKAEATGELGKVEFRGHTFTVPTEYDDFPLDFIEAVADLKPRAIQARALLGPEQWAKVRGMGLTGRDLEPLFDGMEAAMGASSGNSEASSD